MKNISENMVKTRKPHHCWGCTTEYPIGTEMLRVTTEDCGKLSSVYWCKICDKYLQDHRNDFYFDQGFEYGYMLNEDGYTVSHPLKETHD
ncbi:MAG: hypothetical protein PHU23_06055 [Dehalococcoidales bacterium]|nr:hypothetical protein [Dehalococcoidales bacterium]